MPSQPSRRRRAPAPVSLLAVAALAAASAAVPGSPVHAAEPELTAEITIDAWSTGYGAEVVITNHGQVETTGWTVAFDLPAGTTISNHWRADRTQDGQHHTFTNLFYNGDIAPGGTEYFGFNANGLGEPVNCTVDGNPCAGPGSEDTEPPTAPSGLHHVAVTATSVSLAWDPATDNVGVTGYDVHQDGVPVTSATDTSATVTGLSPDTTYTFTVTARDAAENVSAPSNSVTVPTLPEGGGGDVVDVATAAELIDALATAAPGQTIRLAPGEYHGAFLTQRPGTAADPITLTGPRDAVLVNDGPSGQAPPCAEPTAGWDSGYGLWLFDAPYWNLTGFTIADSKKGLVLDSSHHVTIDDLYVHHIDQEGVHFRRSSADGVIRGSRIEETGLVDAGFGEGVYVGSAQSNFGCYGNSGGLDRSDRVQVLDNQIGPYVRGEPMDLKEGTQDGVVRGNTLNGTGISGQNFADSWVDVKGNNYLFENNTGTFSPPGTLKRGYAALNLLDGYGCGNVWRDNHSDVGGGEYAIWIHNSNRECEGNPNVVYSSNTVANATRGLTNIAVTPGG